MKNNPVWSCTITIDPLTRVRTDISSCIGWMQDYIERIQVHAFRYRFPLAIIVMILWHHILVLVQEIYTADMEDEGEYSTLQFVYSTNQYQLLHLLFLLLSSFNFFFSIYFFVACIFFQERLWCSTVMLWMIGWLRSHDWVFHNIIRIILQHLQLLALKHVFWESYFFLGS